MFEIINDALRRLIRESSWQTFGHEPYMPLPKR